MTASTGRETILSSLEAGELEAQRLACAYLVKGCERALFQFGLVAGESANVAAARVDKRAVDIMLSVLSSWRDTLSLLPEASAGQPAGANWMAIQTPRRQSSAIRPRAE